MDALSILAVADAALTLWEHAATQLANARKAGLITAAEQQARLDRFNANRALVGVPAPVVPPPQG